MGKTQRIGEVAGRNYLQFLSLLSPLSKLPHNLRQQQMTNLKHQVMVPEGTYAKHELIRQASEL